MLSPGQAEIWPPPEPMHLEPDDDVDDDGADLNSTSKILDEATCSVNTLYKMDSVKKKNTTEWTTEIKDATWRTGKMEECVCPGRSPSF